MPTRNVNLTDHFDRFIDDGVTSGRFSSASEVVREGLRLLEQREQEDRAKLNGSARPPSRGSMRLIGARESSSTRWKGWEH